MYGAGVSVPTSQTSLAEIAAIPESIVVSPALVAPETTDHDDPSQCSISALSSKVPQGDSGNAHESPTAQALLLDVPATAARKLFPVPTFGLGMTDQDDPSQCSMSVRSTLAVLVHWEPTAQMSDAEIAPRPVRLNPVKPGGAEKTVQEPCVFGVKVNWSALDVADVPAGVATVTSTAVAVEHAGETAVICVGESTVNELAGVEPNVTPVAPVKFVPVMVTLVPPLVGPVVGLTEVIAGRGVGGGGAADMTLKQA